MAAGVVAGTLICATFAGVFDPRNPPAAQTPQIQNYGLTPVTPMAQVPGATAPQEGADPAQTYLPTAAAPDKAPYFVTPVPIGEWRLGYMCESSGVPKKSCATNPLAHAALFNPDVVRLAVEEHAAAVAQVCNKYAYVVSPNGVVVQDNLHSNEISYTTVPDPLLPFLEASDFPTAEQQAAIKAIQGCAAKGYEYPCEGE